MQQGQASRRAMTFHKEIARKHRQEIFAKRRQQMLKKQTEFPLISQTLHTYWQLPASKLYLHRDQIFDTLDNTHGEQLSEEQSYDLCQDLLQLIDIDKEFLIPYSFKFRKDQSSLTATVVAFVYDYIDPKEGNCWLKFMNEESRSTIYLNIQCSEEQDPDRWLNDIKFLQIMIDDWGTLEEAEGAISWLLGETYVQLTDDFVRIVFKKLFQMNRRKQIKQTPTFFTILIRLTLHSQCNQKVFSFLSMLLNESLTKVYQIDISFEFDQSFLIQVDVLLEKAKENCKVIFTEKIFQHLLQMLLNSYHQKFIDENNPKFLKLRVSQKNFQEIQESFLSRVIDICLNHLRMHRLFNNKTRINQKLLQSFHPVSFTKLQQKYIKLIDLNNVYQSKNTNPINPVNTNNLNKMQTSNNNGQEGQQIIFQI